MKIVIAPSKTMVETKMSPKKDPLFDYRHDILLSLKTMSVHALQMLYQSNEKIAQENYQRFQDFKENNIALFAYTGQQFKHLGAQSLSKMAQDYLDEHLLIMSGLYGLVRPYDGVGLYRLPMGVKWQGTLHKNNWKSLISDYLENETVINLASKEYSDAIDGSRVTIMTVDFLVEKNNKLRKAPAMEAKRLRGLMVRHMAEENIKCVDALKTLQIDQYKYNKTLSDTKTLTYKK